MKLKTFPFNSILDWYTTNGRHDLPWRLKQSPYNVWISEIFLQQTQVSRVKEYFHNVTKRFPTIESLAHTDYDTFFPYYQGLGYYSRARNMLKTAHIIHTDFHGVFPQDYQQLISLPGIGPYTAQAILAFGFGENILSFDTNIEKIFARYYFGSRFIKLSKDFKQSIQSQFEKTGISGRDINAALMDFSSMIDINEKNNINYNQYILKESKFFKEKGGGEHKPEKIKTAPSKKDANIYVFIHENHKEYYSSDSDTFQAFSLGKNNKDHRHYIQDYFLTHFGLSLSVRPAYKKGKDYFFYHAQIQAGNHDFGIFSKEDKQKWEDDFMGIQC